MNKNRFFELYYPYLPSFITIIGAILMAAGLLINDSTARFIGALFAAAGTFWSGHRQIKSSAEARMRNEKILELSEKLREALTGGNSFCYGTLLYAGPGRFLWSFLHVGESPLYDTQVRICDLRKPDQILDTTLHLGTLFPGRSHFDYSGKLNSSIEHGTHIQAFNLFFVARNGSWTQEIRWTEIKGGGIAVANRVIRDGTALNTPLLLQISPDYQGQTPADKAWPAG